MATGKTLVLPLVAMGSVPHGREMSIEEVAHGIKSNDKTDGELVSPWELYYEKSKDKDVINDIELMQMHSPIIPGCESLYVKQLVKIIRERGYTKILILDARDRGLFPTDDIIRWSNRTVKNMSINNNEIIEKDNDICTAGNLIRFIAEEVGSIGDDIIVECHAVSVYEGWNGPAVASLVASVGLDAVKNGEDLVSISKEVLGVYN
ncbi:hypothetical protein C6P40_003782 [Pichia californica]|uniref:Uncharacterized protein n=1 Tax=Pichia californica TaxID=460514 RepID=A0A9P6WGT1_9ASCO|nr:hypothetical protein C6P42_003581 [[Candida] californica]KAG0686576.1 hypothetical protein C6P40_003782 [[Candida] californica]